MKTLVPNLAIGNILGILRYDSHVQISKIFKSIMLNDLQIKQLKDPLFIDYLHFSFTNYFN